MRYYKQLDEAGTLLYIGTGELDGVEIEKEEYEILKEELHARQPEPDRPNAEAEATEADYQTALAQMGVNLSDERET